MFSGKICLKHASELKPWSHDTSKSTLKSLQNFTNKSLTEKINKDQMEVRASSLFYEAFELPVQADSSQERLLAHNVFTLEKQGRTELQISAFQKATTREKRILTNCSLATDVVGGASNSKKWEGDEKWKGAETEMCNSITGQFFSGRIHELLKWTAGKD